MQAAAVEVAWLNAEVCGSEAEVKALRALMELREQEVARLHAKVRQVEEEAEGLKSGSRASALALQVYTYYYINHLTCLTSTKVILTEELKLRMPSRTLLLSKEQVLLVYLEAS